MFGDLPPELKELVLFKPQLVDLTQRTDKEFSTHGALAPFETLFKHSHDKADEQKLRLFDETLTDVPSTFLDAALQYILSCIQTSQRREFATMISNHIGEKGFVSIADSFRQEGHRKGRQETMQQVAKNLLASGLGIGFVAKNTGLGVAFLKQLQKETKH